MSVFPMAHYLTMGHPTKKDYIQPFTVMAASFRESGNPPSPMRVVEPLSYGRLRVKPEMTVSRCSLVVLKTLKTTEYANR